MFSGGEALPAVGGAKDQSAAKSSGHETGPAQHLETGVIPLDDAEILPFELDSKSKACEPIGAWKPSVLFNDPAPISNGVPENVHLYPVVEQARQFLERYPLFNYLSETSNFDNPSLRAEVLFNLAKEYSGMNKTLIDDGRSHWVDPNWETNFESALDKVEKKFGIDVRDGVIIADSDIIAVWDTPKGVIELDIASDFLREKIAGWKPELRAEFAGFYRESSGPIDGLEARAELEANFKSIVEGWLMNRRGMPTDVTGQIMKLGIPVQDIPLYVDIAINKHSVWPNDMPKFLAEFALGGIAEVYDPVKDGWDLALDSEVYFKERYEKLKMHVSEIQAKRVVAQLSEVLRKSPLEPLEDGSVFESELNVRFETAVEFWLREKLSHLHPSRLGGKTVEAMAGELMGSVRRTGVGMEMAVGFLNMATNPEWYENDPGFRGFQQNLENLSRYKTYAAETAARGADALASMKARAMELSSEAIRGMEAGSALSRAIGDADLPVDSMLRIKTLTVDEMMKSSVVYGDGSEVDNGFAAEGKESARTDTKATTKADAIKAKGVSANLEGPKPKNAADSDKADIFKKAGK